jgi:superoxide reductase
MATIGELIQHSDWKSEKHVPFIDCPDSVGKDVIFSVEVSLGKEVDHPNTTAHHIRWIRLYFHPDGEKFPYQVANLEFCAHGESPAGADKGSVYTHHSASTRMKTSRPGTLFATAYCNIHGLWESTKEIEVQ